MKAFPLMTAHTGCMGTPDNSVESAEAALKHGADIVEDDIRLTYDGVLVLAHDDAVTLADGTEARISSLTFEETRDWLPSPIAALEPVLALVARAGKMMNLDLKSDDCIGPVFELVDRLGLHDSVFLSGCEFSRAAAAQQQCPGLRKLLNADIRLFQTVSYLDAVKRTAESAHAAGCFGVNIPYQLISPMLLERMADSGLPVYIWTVDEEEQMRLFAGMGVRSITTRNIAALFKIRSDRTQEEAELGL